MTVVKSKIAIAEAACHLLKEKLEKQGYANHESSHTKNYHLAFDMKRVGSVSFFLIANPFLRERAEFTVCTYEDNPENPNLISNGYNLSVQVRKGDIRSPEALVSSILLQTKSRMARQTSKLAQTTAAYQLLSF